MVFDGKKDLNYDKTLKTIRKESSRFGGEFIFDPDSLKEEAKAYRVETSRMGDEELLVYAKLATKLRADFTAKAQAVVAADNGADGNEVLELPASVMTLKRGCKKELKKRD